MANQQRQVLFYQTLLNSFSWKQETVKPLGELKNYMRNIKVNPLYPNQPQNLKFAKCTILTQNSRDKTGKFVARGEFSCFTAALLDQVATNFFLV